MSAELHVCGRCHRKHSEKFRNCSRCRAYTFEHRFKKRVDPIKWSKFARHQTNYRNKRNLDPVEHEKYKAAQRAWRANNPDKVQAQRKARTAYLTLERRTLGFTNKEQKFYSKLITTLFKAQVEW